VYVDYTFDLSQFDVSIFGKQMYEWTTEELRQYLIDNNIYDMSKETMSVVSDTGEVMEDSFYVDGVNYATRGIGNGFEEGIGIFDQQYALYIYYHDDLDNSSFFGMGYQWLEEGEEYDKVLDINEKLIGKSFVDFFGDEEFATVIKNNAMQINDDIDSVDVYGNNIKVTMYENPNETNVYDMDIYFLSLDRSFNITFYDDKIDTIYTKRF
jgi:hypothetical protein